MCSAGFKQLTDEERRRKQATLQRHWWVLMRGGSSGGGPVGGFCMACWSAVQPVLSVP